MFIPQIGFLAKSKNASASSVLWALVCVFMLSGCAGGGGGVTLMPPPTTPPKPVDPTPGLPLPSGHGLMAGQITVAAGASEEHGNVVVTCPAGGGACAVTVAADGTAVYDRTGGTPTFIFAHWTYERDNPTAEDLLDHWNKPEQLRTALGLSVVDAADIADRKNALTELLNSAGGDAAETGTRLRNVRPEDVEIIGERNGITYGRWTGGPAGTFNIDFDYRFAPEATQEQRARIERAGKSWSWRLDDESRRFTVEAGQQVARSRTIDGVPVEELRVDEDVTTDGLVIFVDFHGGTRRSRGGPSISSRSAREQGDFHPYAGSIRIGTPRFDEVSERGNLRLTGLLAHEIGHVMGIGSTLRRDPFVAHVDEAAYTFTGPNAVAEHGGPVPFQWLDNNRNSVPPRTPGASVDWVHIGPCGSVMSYCRHEYDIYAPTELDFAFLKDIGYEVLDPSVAEEPEIYGYGAWGRYSAWGAGVERTITHDADIRGSFKDLDTRDALHATADAFGSAPTTPLTDSIQGTATWSGSLLGVDIGQPMLPPVFGNAELNVDLATLRGSAQFRDLTVHVDSVSTAFRAPELQYSINVNGNTFSDAAGHVQGGFFGPNHEEMAGVLDDRAAAVSLLAGFGGRR